ncbi:hypothetical protein FRC00_009943 [Tulasnella sp. 408]|nr:hypothetical protein FRC00_009943 [Tulasnella sp. 408]
MGDLYRAAAEKEPFLRRFHHNWATTRLAQMYLRNTRSYVANIDIPESAVARRRATTTIKGAKEAGLPPPDLSKLKKKKKPATKDSGAILPEGTGNESSASTSQKAATGSSAKTKGQPGKSQPSKHSVDGNNSTSGLRKVTKPRDNSEVEDEAGAEDGLEDDYPLDRDSEDDDDDQGSENSEEDGGNYRGNGRADDEELEEVGEDGMRHSDDESAVSSDGCGDE